MVGRLRADQWADNHPELPPAERQVLRDAFYTDTDRMLAQGVEQTHQAVAGLGRHT